MTKTSRKSPLRAAVLVGIAVLGASALLVAAGCGDDDSAAAAADTGSAGAPADTSPPPTRYCRCAVAPG